MEENKIFMDVLFRTLIPLYGGCLLTFLLSWIFVTKYVAKRKTMEQAKKIGKLHFRIGLGIMIIALIITISCIILIWNNDDISTWSNDILFFPSLFTYTFVLSSFFYWNNWLIKRKVFRIDMYGDKIDK